MNYANVSRDPFGGCFPLRFVNKRKRCSITKPKQTKKLNWIATLEYVTFFRAIHYQPNIVYHNCVGYSCLLSYFSHSVLYCRFLTITAGIVLYNFCMVSRELIDAGLVEPSC